jgi:RIP metalloprotease RseP
MERDEQKKSRSWKNLFGFASKSAAKADGTSSLEKPQPPPEIEYYDDPNLLQNRPWTQRAVVLAGGVVFNILLAFTCYFGELSTTGLPQPVFREGALITQAPRVDGPSNGLLHKGDVIVGINGKPLMTTRSPNVMQSQEAINEFISEIRKSSPGESLRLSIIQAAADGAGASKGPIDVVVKPQLNSDNARSIGVMLSPNYVRTDKIKAESLPDAVVKASKATSDITTSTARSLLTLLGNVFMGKGTGSQSVSGPIGLIKQGSDVVSSAASGRDIAAVVGFAAAISCNLAVVNSLPLPALDGGQLVFVLAEGLTGKKIDQKRQEEINALALFLLLAFSLNTAVGDVGRLIIK